MRTIHVKEDFTVYINDKRREFKKGEEVEVPNDFAEIVVAKGHAREVAPTVEAKAEPKTAAKSGDNK